ncbi:HIT domain-containing protein [Agaribacter marinus]|uniref:Histidine triad domain protein n=1 Tax=Agaribacter marinus TaxID=1431249 RepID=A0AA37T0I3_9ALTE|nr:HIT family protein [Agaribacter marinus]GLR70223.1 histidine triad domain protein [Agaribacter marinus]
MHFKLHPQLEKDSEFVLDLDVCQLRLINEANYPWLVLIPRLNGIVELSDLSETEYTQTMLESRAIELAMIRLFEPVKMNIAAIGNMVPQLHIHHVARYKNDKAWPAPIWGKHPMQAYDNNSKVLRIQTIKKELLANIQT